MAKTVSLEVNWVSVGISRYPRRKVPVSFVTIFAAGGYGEEPEELTPDQAREVAAELVRLADQVEADAQGDPPDGESSSESQS